MSDGAIPSGIRMWVDDRAQELLEMAFVLPVLLMLFIGIFWTARAFNVWQTITRAAREGARYAVLPNCASCGDVMVDTYSAANTCLSNPTNVFTNHVLPFLQASALSDPTNSAQVPGGSYCQEAVVENPNTDTKVEQCGVRVIITYPVKLVIPFTSLNAATLNISTQVQMRMENQSVDNIAGNAQCPGNQ